MDGGMDQSGQIDQASTGDSLSTASFVTCVATGAWGSLGVSCWAYAAWTPETKLSPSWLTTIAIASAAVTLFVRFYPADLQRHATWRQLRAPITFAATINWLGFILIRSAEPVVAFPSLLIIGFAEAGVLIYRRRKTASSSPPSEPKSRSVESASNPREVGEPQPPKSIDADDLESLLASELSSMTEPEAIQEELGEHLTRRLQVGSDEQGVQYISGELFVTFADDQRVLHATVGFQPAFTSPPAVEIESENADVSAEVQNCTPIGMRLQLKLDRSAPTPASSVVAFYAVAASDPARPAPLP
ncbi:MAG: hypothetical protein Aurels2KO_10940 [Aureliella sp.]